MEDLLFLGVSISPITWTLSPFLSLEKTTGPRTKTIRVLFLY